ncbi:MAG: pyridoxal-phosphate dependent enzyme, partial [Flavobacteriaceae bacterium]|nr:pyridoxal-phosphate dependent enzyme [Flavobacteriaceae bacterium]
MRYAENILETIGNTPLVKLNMTIEDIEALVLAKIETFNPGNSVKDRMAVKMIQDAEASGQLKPGGTIIEGTSGNTGMGLALAAIVKGYKLICVISDKQSKEKMDILRAVGAEVVVCPTNVGPDDPRSYYSVSKRLASETPNSWYVNQYDNLSNTQAHYEQTGPEIWEQTDGKITHFVVGVGTGGTISGVGKFLKEKNPNIKIWGVDTYGSVFKKYHETGIFDQNEIYPYITEGIGEDILPKNVDFEIIDGFTKVTDKDAAVYTRKLAKEEGIFVGNSAGSAIKGLLQLKKHFKKDDVVVVLFHDHGSRYIAKIFNDDWMRERGFLEEEITVALDLIRNRINEPLISAKTEELVS